MLRNGDAVPEFALPDARGEILRASDLRGHAYVIYFYPKDETPGCTAEACAFRDEYDAFTRAGVEVFGVSSDDAESHARFQEHHRLPFRLLSDTGGHARAAFGVPKTLGLLPGRTTFVVDADGVVREVFNSQMRPREHVARALAAIARP